MFGIAGVMAVLASANAAETADIKAACQASDKTLWVERNKVCIPKNPCKDSKYEKYCNRIYKDLELWGNQYMILVEAYAKGHGLSCSPVDTKSKMVGQDYIICMGDDVMVFEFDDISDTPPSFNQDKLDEFTLNYKRLLCEAIGGAYGSGICQNVSEHQCRQLDDLADRYYVSNFLGTSWGPVGDYKEPVCVINYYQRSFFNGGVF